MVKCPSCGADVKKEWVRCSRCGAQLRNVLDDMFSKMMQDTQKMMERQFEVFDITPMFRIPKIPIGKVVSRGFSIQIKTGTGQQPSVSVKSWGMPKGEAEKEIETQIGGLGLKRIEKAKQEIPGPKEKMLPVPKVTEEPKTEVKRLNSKVVVDMELPGVKSEKDISIKELEQSIEVKAMAGEKAYFKIITKPPEFRVVGKKFSKDKLHLEFE